MMKRKMLPRWRCCLITNGLIGGKWHSGTRWKTNQNEPTSKRQKTKPIHSLITSQFTDEASAVCATHSFNQMLRLFLDAWLPPWFFRGVFFFAGFIFIILFSFFLVFLFSAIFGRQQKFLMVFLPVQFFGNLRVSSLCLHLGFWTCIEGRRNSSLVYGFEGSLAILHLPFGIHQVVVMFARIVRDFLTYEFVWIHDPFKIPYGS